MKLRLPLFVFLLFTTMILLNLNAYSQWPALSTPNVQVTSGAITGADLKDYWACSDGEGGSYSIFTDDRQDPGGNESVYCQRIDMYGNVKFATNGLSIGAIATADQDRPKVTDDGFNNAIASWQDSRSGGDDIYSQKIDSKGLDNVDRKFLSFLNLNNNNPIGLDSIASGMGEDSSMLEFVVEPYLIQIGFIMRTPRGRKLTSLGKKYISSRNEKY